MARGTIADRRKARRLKGTTSPTEEAAARVGIGFGHNQGPALDDAPAHDHSSVLTKDGKINISQSKVKTYRRCRRAFHNKFVLGLQKIKRKRPLVFGTIVHQIIEANFEGENWKKVLKQINIEEGAMFRREREMYGDLIQDVKDIMIDYFDHWEGSVKPIRHGGRSSEYEFRIELEDGLWFTGKIDAVVRSKGMRWLMEHKTFSRLPSEDERWRSVQAAVYFRALEEMGFKPMDGILWDYVSSKPCNVPGELTPTGKLSTRRIDTLPSRVRRWIKEEEIDAKSKEAKKLLADATENRRNRFLRIYSPIKPRIVDNIWDDFVDTAKEIADNFGTKKDQNIERHCSWCDYQPLCKAEATGSDLEWLLKREYQTEDQSHKRDDKDRSED